MSCIRYMGYMREETGVSSKFQVPSSREAPRSKDQDPPFCAPLGPIPFACLRVYSRLRGSLCALCAFVVHPFGFRIAPPHLTNHFSSHLTSPPLPCLRHPCNPCNPWLNAFVLCLLGFFAFIRVHSRLKSPLRPLRLCCSSVSAPSGTGEEL